DCSREGKAVLFPENPRRGSRTRRFHPEISSSQPNTPTPSMRWMRRSRAGTRNHWRGKYRITTEAGTAITRPKVPKATLTAYHGVVASATLDAGPRMNQNTATYIDNKRK